MISWTRPPKFIKQIYSKSLWNNWLSQNILFTFDDGPSACTNQLLDIALKYNQKFAFFINGFSFFKNDSIFLDMVK